MDGEQLVVEEESGAFGEGEGKALTIAVRWRVLPWKK